MLGMLQVLNSHMWLGLQYRSAMREHFRHHRKFHWTDLPESQSLEVLTLTGSPSINEQVLKCAASA